MSTIINGIFQLLYSVVSFIIKAILWIIFLPLIAIFDKIEWGEPSLYWLFVAVILLLLQVLWLIFLAMIWESSPDIVEKVEQVGENFLKMREEVKKQKKLEFEEKKRLAIEAEIKKDEPRVAERIE